APTFPYTTLFRSLLPESAKISSFSPLLSRYLHLFQDPGHQLLAFLETASQDQAVRKDRKGQFLNIFRNYICSSLEIGPGPYRLIKGNGSPGTDPSQDLTCIPCPFADIRYIPFQFRMYIGGLIGLLIFSQFFYRSYRLQIIQGIIPFKTIQDLDLFLPVWHPQRQTHEKTV